MLQAIKNWMVGRPGNKARRKRGEMGGKRVIRKVKMSANGSATVSVSKIS